MSIDKGKVQRVAERLRRVDIRSTGYERIIKSCNKDLPADRYPPGGVFFYLDPPYWQTSGYKTFQGESSFGWNDQKRLAELCYEIHKVGNKFIQTNSAHEDLRKLYGSYGCFNIERRDVYYSMAGDGDKRSDAGEFVISNFELASARKQKGLFNA